MSGAPNFTKQLKCQPTLSIQSWECASCVERSLAEEQRVPHGGYTSSGRLRFNDGEVQANLGWTVGGWLEIQRIAGLLAQLVGG